MNRRPYYRSNLANITPTKIDPEVVKKRGWIYEGILVVSEDDPRLGWAEKQFINQIGTRLYGNRKETKND